jgi:hypothetical protein
MNKISQIDSYQIEQLLKRIEQIEAKLEIKVGSSSAESGKEAQNFCALPKVQNYVITFLRVVPIQAGMSRRRLSGRGLRCGRT